MLFPRSSFGILMREWNLETWFTFVNLYVFIFRDMVLVAGVRIRCFEIKWLYRHGLNSVLWIGTELHRCKWIWNCIFWLGCCSTYLTPHSWIGVNPERCLCALSVLYVHCTEPRVVRSFSSYSSCSYRCAVSEPAGAWCGCIGSPGGVLWTVKGKPKRNSSLVGHEGYTFQTR